MKDIKIGKLIFTKRAILKIAFLMFILGIFLGGLIAAKEKGNSSPLIIISLSILIPIFYKMIPSIKREIVSAGN